MFLQTPVSRCQKPELIKKIDAKTSISDLLDSGICPLVSSIVSAGFLV